MKKRIDVNFDFQAEANDRDSFDFSLEANIRDADRWSPTLQKYHSILWNKPLPGGAIFTLAKESQNRFSHKSKLGEFLLSSDRAIPTFISWKKLQHIISQVPTEKQANFYRLADTIGGILIWPCNQVDKKMTINAAKGCNGKISDRLDLTIECIRRYYQDQYSPLYDTFKRYASFFSLFQDFKGYIDFFLLKDIVSDHCCPIKSK